MFEKALFVTSDISAGASQAMASLKDLRSLGTVSVLLVQCQPVFDLDEMAMAYLGEQFDKALSVQKDQLIQEGFSTEARIAFGLTRADILQMADEAGCGLIAAAAARQSWLGGFLYGSLAYEMIYNKHLPVLMIRQSENNSADTLLPLFQHVLLPTDFSDDAASAFSLLLKMSPVCGRITLLHVQDKGRFQAEKMARLDEFNEKDRGRLQAMRQELQNAGAAQVDIVLTLGSPTEEILHLISEQAVSLTVMGSQGKGFLQDIFIGSVSHNIARHSDSSVLLVPTVLQKEKPDNA